MSSDAMDVGAVREGLAKALELQYGSVLNYSVAAGGIAGLEYRGLANDLWAFAEAELRDVQVFVEKLTALGGRPPQAPTTPRWSDDSVDLIRQLIDHEGQAIAALHAVIPATGQEGRSEALEHLLEHAIMRKQRQLDLLARSVGMTA